MKFGYQLLALGMGCLGMGTYGHAADKKISESELPSAVQKAVKDVSRGATIRGYSKEAEDGRLEYEVQMTVGGHSRDVSMAPDGRVLEVEEQVELGSLPAGVQDALESRAGKGSITKVESLTKGGKLVAYEAKVLAGGKRSEIQVGPEGQKLSHEE